MLEDISSYATRTDQFATDLENQLAAGIGEYELDDLDDSLVDLAKSNDRLCEQLLETALELYVKHSRFLAATYALNTLTYIASRRGEGHKAVAHLRHALRLATTHNFIPAGRSVAANAIVGVQNGVLSVDDSLVLLREVVVYYGQIGEDREAVSALIAAADSFAAVGAFQASYRVLADAERLAKQIEDFDILTSVFVSEGNAAFLEKDFPFVEKVMQHAVDLFNAVGRTVPVPVRANLALAWMHLGRITDAINVYTDILESAKLDHRSG